MSEPIAKIWIEEGCISCAVCTDLVPQVFLVEDGMDCAIRPEAAKLFDQLGDDIRQAAEDCPVEVIKIEVQPVAR